MISFSGNNLLMCNPAFVISETSNHDIPVIISCLGTICFIDFCFVNMLKIFYATTVCLKPWNFPSILSGSNAVVKLVRVQLHSIHFIFMEAEIRTWNVRNENDSVT